MTEDPTRDLFEYVIDAEDVIVQVNESWKRFAHENDGGGLGDEVVGTWLWQHLAGLEVKHLFRVLLDRVREGQKVVRVPFRCDSPELKRHMMLEVTPQVDSGIRFNSWVVSQEHRPSVQLLEAGRETDPDRHLRMCAWCKRIDSGVDDWRELEMALSEMGLFHIEPLPRITHGVCRDCRSLVLRELGEGA